MTTPDANVNIMCEAISQGLDLQSAADLAGIGASTVSTWTSNPQNDTHRRNASLIRLAAAEYAEVAIAGITGSGARGHEWVMEHSPTYRERYGARVETDADTASVQVLASLGALLAARVATEDTRAGLPARARETPALPAPDASE